MSCEHYFVQINKKRHLFRYYLHVCSAVYIYFFYICLYVGLCLVCSNNVQSRAFNFLHTSFDLLKNVFSNLRKIYIICLFGWFIASFLSFNAKNNNIKVLSMFGSSARCSPGIARFIWKVFSTLGVSVAPSCRYDLVFVTVMSQVVN